MGLYVASSGKIGSWRQGQCCMHTTYEKHLAIKLGNEHRLGTEPVGGAATSGYDQQRPFSKSSICLSVFQRSSITLNLIDR